VYAPIAFLALGPHYPGAATLIPAAATLSLFTLLLVSQWWLDRKPASAR
jgi:hypothetical protein